MKRFVFDIRGRILRTRTGPGMEIFGSGWGTDFLPTWPARERAGLAGGLQSSRPDGGDGEGRRDDDELRPDLRQEGGRQELRPGVGVQAAQVLLLLAAVQG